MLAAGERSEPAETKKDNAEPAKQATEPVEINYQHNLLATSSVARFAGSKYFS